MKILFCYIMLCLFLSQAAIGQTGLLRGKVQGPEGVLQGATVLLGDKAVLSDRRGEFSISITSGTYKLTITHAGLNKIEREIKIESGKSQVIDFMMNPVTEMDEVVLLGSRSAIERTNLNSAVPVDAFTSEKLLQTGQQGLIQMLHFLLPSFNAERQLTNEPVTLRGLNPDHLLILLNGTRYHNLSWLNNGTPKSNLGRGSVSNDLNSIPFSAIEKVEILRDGAAAQYGSDAIAGVINIRLKESFGKSSFQLHSGQFYAGDGLKISLGLNCGIRINKKGFLNYSGSFRHQAQTTRAGLYGGTSYLKYPAGASATDSARIKFEDDSIILARKINRKDFYKYNGNNKLNSGGMLINAGYPVGDRSSLYLTGSVNYRENSNSGSYRFPKDISQVNTELHPDGFKPNVDNTNWDISVYAGIKAETKHHWHWELGSSIGSNSNRRFVNNSNNASQYSLGKNAPTSFYLGQLIYRQSVNHFSLTKSLTNQMNHFKSANISLGAEWRWENYRQQAGDEAAWETYDGNGSRQGGSQPSIGVVNANNVINTIRTISAAYAELEIETTDHFLFNLAGRYEYYNDFGGNIAGKLAFRYKVTRNLSFRASAGNGFRAPSMQQRYFEGTQSFRGSAQTQGIFSNTSEVTKAFGIPSLEAERSINLSGGLVMKMPGRISLTVDAYWIQIRNRIVLSGVFDKSNPDVATLLVNYPAVDLVQFYTNAINTRTSGIDIVLSGNWQWQKTGLVATLAANFNRNRLFGPIKSTDKISNTAAYSNTLFGIEERTTLESEQPGEKVILSANLSRGKFGFVLRNTLFGNTASTNIVVNPIDTLYEYLSAKILTDFNINYSPKSWLTITAGGNNIFDVYPDRLQNYRLTGQGGSLYSNAASPFGYNGGYYYVNMSFKW